MAPASCPYEAVLRELLLKDSRLIVMTAENRAMLRNLPAFAGDRFIDTGITEQTLVGMAAGLALRGRRPWIHALAPFLTMRAFEFIRTDVGLGNLPVKLTGFVPGLLSDGNGPTHQSLEDIALMRGIPNMDVFSPGDEEDLVASMNQVFESPQPVYVRYNNRPATFKRKLFKGYGEAEIVSQTSERADVTLLVHGTLFRETLECADLLRSQGGRVNLVNVRWLKPFDFASILPLVTRSQLTVTIEDHFKTGGLYSALCTSLVEEGVPARVHSISFDERWFKPGLLGPVLEHERLTAPQLALRIEERLKEI